MVCCCTRGVLLVLLSLLSAPVRPSPPSPSPAPALLPPPPSSSSSSSSSSLVSETREEPASLLESEVSDILTPFIPSSTLSSSSSSSSSEEYISPLASATLLSDSSPSSATSSLESPSSSRTAALPPPPQPSSSSSTSARSPNNNKSPPKGATKASPHPQKALPQTRGSSGKAQGARSSAPSSSSHDRRVLKAVEKSLLNSLGLQSRPRGRSRSGGGAEVDVEVPPYMWELYRAQVASASSASTAIRSPFLQGYRSGSGGGSAVSANTVRSFYHEDHHVTEGCDPGTCARILFDVTSVPDSETLAAAELRLFIDHDLHRNHSDLDPSKGHPPKVKGVQGSGSKALDIVVEVHEIMQTGAVEWGDDDLITRLLDTRRVRVRGKKGGESSWESFDIHPAVLKWKRGASSNKGLEIRLRIPRDSSASAGAKKSSAAGSSEMNNSASPRHVRVRRSASVSEERWRMERPLLVTYTDDGKGRHSRSSSSPSSSSSSSSKARSKRAAQAAKRKKRDRRRKSRAGKASKRNRRNRKKKKRRKRKRQRKGDKNQCRRHALYVDFQEVGWEDWIVAPDGYNAYFCQGDCNFPLAQHLNSTNHAIVQTLVNSVDPTAVSKACCVPTELSAISMLYLNERGKVQLKNYQDMVVEACGCR